MQIDVVLASALVGVLVGMTGAGGGALMTPMLIVVFSVRPEAAISSDLAAAVLMRPFGAAVHFRRGHVNGRLVGLLAAGSVPAALCGTLALRVLGGGGSQDDLRLALGAALLAGTAGMAVRAELDRRTTRRRDGDVRALRLRPAATVAVGALGGLVVGMTSVGAGSLMVVLLLFLYPTIGARQLVGTDLAQAVPLTLAAAAGAFAFGHVALPLTASVVAGSVPGVVAGSLASSWLPERALQPLVTAVVLASGLREVGLGGGALLVALPAVLLAALAARRVARRLPVPAPARVRVGERAVFAEGGGRPSGPGRRPGDGGG